MFGEEEDGKHQDQEENTDEDQEPSSKDDLDDSPGEIDIENSTIKFAFEDIEESCIELQDRTLIKNFNRLVLSPWTIQEWATSTWGGIIQGTVHFEHKGKDFFNIFFQSLTDLEKVLYEGPWFYKRAGLALRRWTPLFNPENLGPLKIPIWVKLPYLPDEFRYPDRLQKIGFVLGKVLCIDDDTDNHNI